MSRKDRRASDPVVQTRKAEFAGGNKVPASPYGVKAPSGDGGGGWGVPSPKAKPATGARNIVDPWATPKSAGLGVTTQVFSPNYYVEWNYTTWRYVCDQAINFGFTRPYATLVTWVFESSPFIQSLFRTMKSFLNGIKFYYKDMNGEILEDWTRELCAKKWQRDLRREMLFGPYWGFAGINFDPIQKKIYKYPMQQIDPINRMLRPSTYTFDDGVKFDEKDNMIFVQGSTNYEEFLGPMQAVARAYITIMLNKNNWVSAGKRLAFPLIIGGYPQEASVMDAMGNEINQFKIQAERILEDLDPSKALVVPYTVNAKGEIEKAIQIDFEKPGTGARSFDIYDVLNEAEKNEIRELFLGGSLTADVEKNGSRALGEIQERKLAKMFLGDLMDLVDRMNEDYKPKISKYYENMPEGYFDIDTTNELTIDEIVAYSNVLSQNGKRFTDNFFESNGLSKDFFEDAPDPVKMDGPPPEKPLKAGDISRKEESETRSKIMDYPFPKKK